MPRPPSRAEHWSLALLGRRHRPFQRSEKSRGLVVQPAPLVDKADSVNAGRRDGGAQDSRYDAKFGPAVADKEEKNHHDSSSRQGGEGDAHRFAPNPAADAGRKHPVIENSARGDGQNRTENDEGDTKNKKHGYFPFSAMTPDADAPPGASRHDR